VRQREESDVRDGYRIIDTDTHVGPNVETLHRYAGPRLLARWDELTPYLQPVTDGGHSLSMLLGSNATDYLWLL
jgi:hypothetical protein